MGWKDVKSGANDKEDKIPISKLAEGATTIRVLDDEPYSFWSHWMASQNIGINCLGKDCPVCAIIAQQKANKDPNKKYNSSKRHALRIWNYSTNQMEILIQGNTFFQNLSTYNTEVGDLRNYDIKVLRKGLDTSTTYTMIPQQPSEFKNTDKCVEVDLKELLKPYDKEIVLQLMEGKTFEEIFKSNEDQSE